MLNLQLQPERPWPPLVPPWLRDAMCDQPTPAEAKLYLAYLEFYQEQKRPVTWPRLVQIRDVPQQ